MSHSIPESELKKMSPAELSLQLEHSGPVNYNGIVAEDVETSLVECFERVAGVHHKRKAIASGKWQPSYEELNFAANHLSHAMLASGGGPGDRVAILMKQDGPLIAAVLAVLKAGRVVVVLDPGDPPVRLNRMVSDAAPGMLLTDLENANRAAEVAHGHCAVVSFEDHFATEAKPNPGIRTLPDDLASIAFTSGSTGHPKGVMGTNRSVLHHVLRCSRGMEVLPSDRIAALSSLSGGQGIGLTWCALLNGAAVCHFTGGLRNSEDIAVWMVKCSVTIFASATSVFRGLIKNLPPALTFTKVRLVRIGSESTTWEDFRLFKSCFSPDCVLMHAFSTSESGNLTQLRLTAHDEVAEGLLPVGLPTEGLEVLLLDEQDQEVAQGETGEIAVRSRYLSPGYWRDLSQTKKYFFNADSGERLRIYRTGDLGHFTCNGLLVVSGRADGRINVLGHSVDLSEIENALLKLTAVEAALVCTSSGARDNQKIVAGVVLRGAPALTDAKLREELLGLLPGHMLPAVIVTLDAIPLTSTGKPDRRKFLTDLEEMSKSDVVAPRTNMEKRIAGVWSHCLNISSISVYDNFFAKGGDSLCAVELMSTLSKMFGHNLPMDLLINHPSIAQMAEALDAGFVPSVRNQWFRPWQATLLTLRRDGSGSPIIFIPGGYTSESELLVCAGLIPFLDAGRPVFGVRLNLLARGVWGPWSLRAIARQVARRIIDLNSSVAPVLIGECQSCALAMETAQVLAKKLKSPPQLLLLDPWQPSNPSSQETVSDIVHPPAIARYYRLSRGYQPDSYPGESHIICTAETARLPSCLDWWRKSVGPGCRGHEVPGDHDSYIRQHRASLGKMISAICSKDSFSVQLRPLLPSEQNETR
ncbi:hypothetical protein BH11VER1_BH11VER1_09770 [soil metagenome]